MFCGTLKMCSAHSEKSVPGATSFQGMLGPRSVQKTYFSPAMAKRWCRTELCSWSLRRGQSLPGLSPTPRRGESLSVQCATCARTFSGLGWARNPSAKVPRMLLPSRTSSNIFWNGPGAENFDCEFLHARGHAFSERPEKSSHNQLICVPTWLSAAIPHDLPRALILQVLRRRLRRCRRLRRPRPRTSRRHAPEVSTCSACRVRSAASSARASCSGLSVTGGEQALSFPKLLELLAPVSQHVCSNHCSEEGEQTSKSPWSDAGRRYQPTVPD